MTICCTDTDVVVLAVATFQQLGLEKLWIGFGRNKDDDGFQYMKFQKIWEFLQLDSLSSMLSMDVALFLHFAERVRSLHGKNGRVSQMSQMYSPATFSPRDRYGNYRVICLYNV